MQMSVYNFEVANVEALWKHLELYETECRRLIADYEDKQKRSRLSSDPLAAAAAAESKRRFPLLGAYELCVKCSHLFNLLDARGALSVTERVAVIARIRQLAVGIAMAWIDQRRGENPPRIDRGT
jgi:glycyl-tRNA synthetase alpha chain